MAARRKAKSEVEKIEETVQILQIQKRQVTFYVLGTSPLCMNRMPKKVREELLLGKRKKNKAELAMTLKHNPIAEFNDAIYRCRDPKSPTLIHLPNGAFKKAIAQTAIDIPGATKAQIGRLVSIADTTVHLYGKPFLYMDVVRLNGPGHPPDIRTRAMFPQWCCKVTLSYIGRLILERDLMNLFAAAGLICGIGDGRTEKGSRDNGQWDIVGANDPRWKEVAKQGRAVQEAAMLAAESVDIDSEELLAWYKSEIIRREQDPAGYAAADDDEVDTGPSDDELGADDAIAEATAPRRNGRRKQLEAE